LFPVVRAWNRNDEISRPADKTQVAGRGRIRRTGIYWLPNAITTVALVRRVLRHRAGE
jgi:hypothetical protein